MGDDELIEEVENSPRSVFLHIRMDAADKDALIREAEARAMTLSQYARIKLAGKVKPLPAEYVADLRAIAYEIKKQGINLNQTVHNTNLFIKSGEVVPERVDELLDEIHEALHAMRICYVALGEIIARHMEGAV